MPRKPAAEYDIKAKDGSAAGWRQALKTADSAGKKITGIMKTAFAGVSLAAISASIKASFEFGDEIGKAAVKAGIGAKAMSELAFAARMSDIDIGSLSTSIRKMQVELSKASTGGKEQKEALAALGLEIVDLKSMKADQQFEVIGDAISRLRDPTDRARAATALFGRAGADLLPLFEQGAEGLRKARAEAEKFGVAFDEKAIEALQKGDEAIKKLGAAWDGFAAKLAIGTVAVLEGLDLIDKDKIGELQDELERVNEELLRMQRGANTGAMDPEQWDLLTQKAKALERQVANLNDAYTRGGGGRRGRGTQSAPGFEKAAAGPAPIVDAFTPEMREAIRAAEQWVVTINEADSSTRKFIEGAMDDLPEVFDDLPEPILKLSESLIQADELQKEFTRSMFSNFSDLFMSIGKGSDDMADAFINAIKRMLSDRATLEMFELLAGLGGSITGKSGGNGFWGWVGAGLTSLFGGTRDSGGRGQPGKGYVIGTGAQPEMFVPDSAGTFYPRQALAGAGSSVTIHMHNDFSGATPDAVKLFMAREPHIIKQAADVAEARLRDKRRRGQF